MAIFICLRPCYLTAGDLQEKQWTGGNEVLNIFLLYEFWRAC
jgi:hypothetical protein